LEFTFGLILLYQPLRSLGLYTTRLGWSCWSTCDKCDGQTVSISAHRLRLLRSPTHYNMSFNYVSQSQWSTTTKLFDSYFAQSTSLLFKLTTARCGVVWLRCVRRTDTDSMLLYSTGCTQTNRTPQNVAAFALCTAPYDSANCNLQKSNMSWIVRIIAKCCHNCLQQSVYVTWMRTFADALQIRRCPDVSARLRGTMRCRAVIMRTVRHLNGLLRYVVFHNAGNWASQTSSLWSIDHVRPS